MPGLVPGIERASAAAEELFWIAGSSPAMTTVGGVRAVFRMLARR
ncbi:hypothetical protein ACUN0C_19585 [Faunimonas sp. B44]